MCAFAEFRCWKLSLTWPLLPEVAERFDVFIQRYGDRASVCIPAFDDGCMCEPSDEMRTALRALAEDLCLHSLAVQYSPNDYSDSLWECELLDMTTGQAFSEYFPSLDTGPMRINLRL